MTTENDRKAERVEFGEPWNQCGSDRGGCPCQMIWSQAHDIHIATVIDEKDPDAKAEGIPTLTVDKAKEYASRIVSCVNALRGIPDPEKYREAFEKMKVALENTQTWLMFNGPIKDDGLTNKQFIKANNAVCAALTLANTATGSEAGKEK